MNTSRKVLLYYADQNDEMGKVSLYEKPKLLGGKEMKLTAKVYVTSL